MRVFLISGKSGSGKDTLASMMERSLTEAGERVLIIHYADLLKYVCRQFFGWDGNKDQAGRSLLQYVGTDVVRRRDENYWVNWVCGFIKLFEVEWDYVLIPDARFPNEVSIPQKQFHATHIRVFRPGYKNELLAEQKEHPSECALDNWDPDIPVWNYTLEELQIVANAIVELALSNQI